MFGNIAAPLYNLTINLVKIILDSIVEGSFHENKCFVVSDTYIIL